MSSFTDISGSISTILTNIPNWIAGSIEDPQLAATLSLGAPVLGAGSVCEIVPGCSSVELPT